MNKFKIILQYGSGYRKYKCLNCGNEIAIPCEKKNIKTIWCYYCDNTEK